jgi:carboxylesterase type B
MRPARGCAQLAGLGHVIVVTMDYIGGMNVKSADDFRARLAKDWPESAQVIAAAYPLAGDVDEQLAALYSDWGMTCPTRRDARWFADAGVRTYLYRFTHALLAVRAAA